MWNQEIKCSVNPSGNNCSKNLFCIRNFRKQAGSSEAYDSEWQCVEESTISEWIELGDDNRWQSELKFKAESNLQSPNTEICAFYSRYSPDSLGTIEENECSAKASNYSNEIYLGDDTGWINQKLAWGMSSNCTETYSKSVTFAGYSFQPLQ